MKKQKNANETPAPAPETARPANLPVLREGINGLQPYYGVPIRDLRIDTPATEWPTSLDRRVPEQRAAIFAAGNPADVSCPLGGTITFTAVHWLIYLQEFLNEETGEVAPGPVLTLYDREGRTFRSTSQFAPRRLKAALELYSPDEWINGITFVVRDRPSKRPGRHYHDVRVAIEETR